MIVAQISDTHISLSDPDSEQCIRDFRAVIEDINTLDPLPDVVIHSGDIVHNGRAEEYAVAVDVLSNARAPIYAMVGNKDNRARMQAAFTGFGFLPAKSEFVEYTINHLPVRVLVLDTLHPQSNKGDFCEMRLRNLTQKLHNEPEMPTAVFMHHPPCEIYVGPDLIHFETREVMDAVCDELQSSGNVLSIFCGHVHRSTSGRVGNIPVSVMSAVATTLRRGDYPDHLKCSPTYQIHRYQDTSGFVTETRIVNS